MATCRSCYAPIIWAKTEKGNILPVDATAAGEPAPADDGNLALSRHDGVFHARVVHADGWDSLDGRLFIRGRYRSHFATCPNAAKHRRPLT